VLLFFNSPSLIVRFATEKEEFKVKYQNANRQGKGISAKTEEDAIKMIQKNVNKR